MDRPPLWGPGWTIAGRYRLVRPLGRGAMGSVWQAEHETLRAPMAVKLIEPALLHPASDKRAEVTARFLIEAQAAATLRSPHVVQILDYGVERDVPYIAMELLEGETLGARLGRARVLPYAETARVVTHVARALTKAHEAGIVHRDLKPDNVFLCKNDDESVIKVLDFGVAKTAASLVEPRAPSIPDAAPIALTRFGTLIGTPAYMSPEQMLGDRPVDARSDLWALAVIAFECVYGSRPFEGDTTERLAAQICAGKPPRPPAGARVPPGFDAWLETALARDPAARFQSAKHLADALRSVLEQPALESPSLPPPRPEFVSTDATTMMRARPDGAHADGAALTTSSGDPERARLRRAAVATGVVLGALLILVAVVARRETPTASATPAPEGAAWQPPAAAAPPRSAEAPAPPAAGIEPAPEAPVASATAATPASSAKRRGSRAPRPSAPQPKKDDPRLGF
jgi:eukaryotic-like serine/threonine-protein kinase